MRKKLRALGDPHEEDSLAWWITKSRFVLARSEKKGRTAKELRIELWGTRLIIFNKALRVAKGDRMF